MVHIYVLSQETSRAHNVSRPRRQEEGGGRKRMVGVTGRHHRSSTSSSSPRLKAYKWQLLERSLRFSDWRLFYTQQMCFQLQERTIPPLCPSQKSRPSLAPTIRPFPSNGVGVLTDHRCVGHTSWAGEGREEQSQAVPKSTWSQGPEGL